MAGLKAQLAELYTGSSPGAVRFRYVMIVFDLATVLFFIVTVPVPETPANTGVVLAIFALILIDMLARFWIAPNRLQHLGRVYVIADIVVIASFVLNPLLHIDLTFLRILRGLRLGDSNYLLRDLRRSSRFFREREGAIVAAVYLVVFVFATAAAVYTFFVGTGQGLAGYVDAIYFTVTTLTTTGYGDLTPTTMIGKAIAMIIMIVGVSLFVNLARAIVMPNKVHFPCPKCGLTRHDPDAVHCKHCGEVVRIETTGFG